MAEDKVGVPQGTLELSRDSFQVNPGSLFPTLYRLEQDGRLKAEWRATENKRHAKYYALTAAGRRHMDAQRKRYERASSAIASVLAGARC